jgi:hypothetical protein
MYVLMSKFFFKSNTDWKSTMDLIVVSNFYMIIENSMYTIWI